jgi:dTDP-glucose 4,6-dehydratase
MNYFIDIDDTIFELIVKTDYHTAIGIPEAIAKVNALYDEGHKIVLWTGRGSTTGRDWRALTEEQLKHNGVKYHELRLDKPAFDVFVDDKAINAKDWLK